MLSVQSMCVLACRRLTRVTKSINQFQPAVAYLYLFILFFIRRTKGFLMFSGGIDKQHQVVTGYKKAHLGTCQAQTRGGSRTAAISKMELFVIIVNGFQPLTIITKCSILDVSAVLHPPLQTKKCIKSTWLFHMNFQRTASQYATI